MGPSLSKVLGNKKAERLSYEKRKLIVALGITPSSTALEDTTVAPVARFLLDFCVVPLRTGVETRGEESGCG